MADGKITFVGGGVMCEAIVGGLVAADVRSPGQIHVSEPIDARRTQLAARHGIHVHADTASAVRNAEAVVLAVKPQHAPQVFEQIRPALVPHALVISIMAGVTVRSMQQALGDGQPIVRVMPNTPAQLGLGASGWYATPAVTASQLATTRAILGAMGSEVQFEQEYAIDMVTGVSGSGPAFVFLFAEAYIDAAVRIGMARPAAEKLCLQTLKGSVALLEQSGLHPAQLKNQVTSAGGTTAAGLHALELGALRATMENAVEAAWRRAQELGAK